MIINEEDVFLELCIKQNNFQSYQFKDMDLSNIQLNNLDFSHAIFENIKFDNANLQSCNFFHCLFINVSFENANLKYTNLSECDLKNINLKNSDICGANLYFAILEKAQLDNIVFDESTKYFDLICPKEKAFIGYKKCFNYRIVKLLIPSDAKRTSATNEACRCSKAKVLSITSFDNKKIYQEAVSLADDNFIYRVGQWICVEDFDIDRWNDSSRGIHFYLDRQQAIDY